MFSHQPSSETSQQMWPSGPQQDGSNVDIGFGGRAAHVDGAVVPAECVGGVIIPGENEKQVAAGVHQRAEPGW